MKSVSGADKPELPSLAVAPPQAPSDEISSTIGNRGPAVDPPATFVVAPFILPPPLPPFV